MLCEELQSAANPEGALTGDNGGVLWSDHTVMLHLDASGTTDAIATHAPCSRHLKRTHGRALMKSRLAQESRPSIGTVRNINRGQLAHSFGREPAGPRDYRFFYLTR